MSPEQKMDCFPLSHQGSPHPGFPIVPQNFVCVITTVVSHLCPDGFAPWLGCELLEARCPLFITVSGHGGFSVAVWHCERGKSQDAGGRQPRF